MSEEHRKVEDLDERKKSGIFSLSFWNIITLITFSVSLLTTGIELFKHMGDFPPVNITSPTSPDKILFSMSDEMFAHMSSCHYEFLFFCSDDQSTSSKCTQGTSLDRSVCILTDAGQKTQMVSNLPFFVVATIGAIELLPRLPDATINMLHHRWSEGPLAFWLGIFFILVYITIVVVSLRMPVPFLAFVMAIVFGLHLAAGLFYLFAEAVLWTGAAYHAVVAILIPLGICGCLWTCLSNDTHEVIKILRLLGR